MAWLYGHRFIFDVFWLPLYSMFVIKCFWKIIIYVWVIKQMMDWLVKFTYFIMKNVGWKFGTWQLVHLVSMLHCLSQINIWRESDDLVVFYIRLIIHLVSGGKLTSGWKLLLSWTNVPKPKNYLKTMCCIVALVFPLVDALCMYSFHVVLFKQGALPIIL